MAANTDYLSFAESALLLALALMLRIRRHEFAGAPRWGWVAVFAVVLMPVRWMSMLDGAGMPLAPAAWMPAIESLAFVALLLFSCSSLPAARRPVMALTGMILPPVAGVAVGAMFGRDLGVTAARASLLLIAGGWAMGATCLGQAGERRGDQPVCCLAGIFLFFYAWSCALPSMAGMAAMPVDEPGRTIWLSLAGARIGFLALAVTAAIGAGPEFASSMPILQRFRDKPFLWAGLAGTLVLVAGGATVVDATGRYGDRARRDGLLQRAAAAALALDGDLVAQLQGAPADAGTPVYTKVAERLRQLRAGNRDIRFVYLMGRHGDAAVFLAESEPETSPDHSPPGQVYDEASEDLLAMFRGHQPLVEGPEEDRWGVWMSAFAPVRDRAGGFVAVLGLDVDAHAWQASVAQHRLAGMAMVLALLLLGLMLIAGLHGYHTFSRAMAGSEERFRVMFEHAPEAVFLFETKTGRIRAANPFMAHWMGYSAAELTAARIDGLVADPARLLARGIRGGSPGATPGDSVEVYLRKDGTRVEAETTTTALRFRDADCVVAFARDITGRRKAEKALQRRDLLLNSVAEATRHLLSTEELPTAIHRALGTLGAAAGADRVYIFQNHPHPQTGEPAMSQRYEWCAEGVATQIDNPELQNLPYSVVPRWYAELNERRSIAGPIRGFPADERPILEAQGIRSLAVVPVMVDSAFWGFIGYDDCREERHWSVTEIAILDAAAGIVGGALLRRETVETLRRREAELRKLALVASRTDSAVLVTDPAGLIEWSNDAFTRLTGHAAPDVTGKPCLEVMAGLAAAPEALADIRDRMRTGRGFKAEVPGRTRDGRPYWAHLEIQPVADPEGRIANYVVIESDITERRTAEERLRSTLDEIERFNRLMVNREVRVLELKREINRLRETMGLPPPYPSVGNPAPRAGGESPQEGVPA